MAWLGHPDCKATWGPASIPSSSLFADYEAGIQRWTITDSATTYGHISTLVTKNNLSPEPSEKKLKVDDSNEQNEQRLVSIILLLLLLEAHGVLHLVYCLIENVALLYTIML